MSVKIIRSGEVSDIQKTLDLWRNGRNLLCECMCPLLRGVRSGHFTLHHDKARQTRFIALHQRPLPLRRVASTFHYRLPSNDMRAHFYFKWL